MSNLELQIGKPYRLNGDKYTRITPIKILSRGRALFASEDFGYTPYISWEYTIVDQCTLEVFRGNYYADLYEALEEEDDE